MNIINRQRNTPPTQQGERKRKRERERERERKREREKRGIVTI